MTAGRRQGGEGWHAAAFPPQVLPHWHCAGPASVGSAHSTLCEGHSGCRWLRPRTVLQTLAPGITLCSSHGHFLRPLLSSSFRLCCSGAAVQWGRAGEGRRKKWGAALQKKRKKSEKAVIWGLGMLVVSPLPLPDPPFQTRMKRLLRNSPGLALSASV